jgi:NAD+ synthase
MSLQLPKELEFDWEIASEDIVNAIRWHLKNTNSEKGVIGLSGGLDSSVTAFLAVKALGKENVFGFVLPEHGVTPNEDIEDALKLAEFLKMNNKLVEITPIVEMIAKQVPEVLEKGPDGKLKKPLAYGNIKARVRMIILYANANLLGKAQVFGTGNKSELLLGYSTKYGDHGVDLLPIGDLYKSQVRYLAEKLGLFERIWTKAPAPRLLKDQTAESEIGVDYNVIDRVLYYKVEERYDEDKIADELGISKEIVKKLCNMIVQSHHKRKSPPICKIGSATINWDWRMPVE